jgi:hypothetical protein
MEGEPGLTTGACMQVTVAQAGKPRTGAQNGKNCRIKRLILL